MKPTTPLDVMHRLVGVKELPEGDHPLIQWGFLLCGLSSETPDEVPWCSAVMQIPSFVLDLPRSKSARARSWLVVGQEVPLGEAVAGYDVVIMARGDGHQPGPEVIDAPGHVAFFEALDANFVRVVGGNQADAVSSALFHRRTVLGVRRLGG